MRAKRTCDSSNCRNGLLSSSDSWISIAEGLSLSKGSEVTVKDVATDAAVQQQSRGTHGAFLALVLKKGGDVPGDSGVRFKGQSHLLKS